MRFKFRLFFWLIVGCLIVLQVSTLPNLSFAHRHQPLSISASVAQAQDNPAEENLDGETPADSPSKKSEFESAEVRLNGKVIYTISEPLGERSPQARAKQANELIKEVAEDEALPVNAIKVVKIENLVGIQVGDRFIDAITPDDANAAGMTITELSKEQLQGIREAVQQYRKDREPAEIRRGLIRAVIATGGFVLAFLLLNRALPRLYKRFRIWQDSRIQDLEVQGLEVVSRERIVRLLNLVFRFILIGSNFLLLYAYIPFLLACFPVTNPISRRLVGAFWNAVNIVVGGIVDYLPNLFIIALIVIIAYYSIKVAKFIFRALHEQRLSFRGFYPEWAYPTQNIVVFLIIGLAAVMIYPYLPAASSTGFQGVSVFIGALFTFGSTAVIGNIISGIVMIYTRSFQVNDVIKVNKIRGRVKDKTMLSTQIITPDNEIITLPNATLFAAEITNYTAALRDDKKPLVLKATITLGYDVPWRKVHKTLVNAALDCKDVLKDPLPFVVQSSLDDFYVAYTLKAFTEKPYRMQLVYSQIYQSIQDKCNEADIEILSPHYRAVRDGHMITIPADYLPEDYEVPGFRMEK